MRTGSHSPSSAVLPVSRSKQEARCLYDRVSRWYDCIAGTLEDRYARMALERLSIRDGETVLEIGFGTGRCLKQIARQVGKTGKACGIDISPKMLALTRRKLKKAQLMDRAELCLGDAASLPCASHIFNAVFISFTLELFDTSDIAKVLAEIYRVLKPGGRLGVSEVSRLSPYLCRSGHQRCSIQNTKR